MSFARWVIFLTWVGPLLAMTGSTSKVKILTDEPGVYRVSYEELAEVGLIHEEIASQHMGLSNRGEVVPMWVIDGDDGRFGPGDLLEFRGEHLPGEVSYHHEFSGHNVYLLDFQAVTASRMTPHTGTYSPAGTSSPDVTQGEIRLERDTLLMRFRALNYAAHETWYWHKLACTDPKPFSLEFDLPNLAQTSERHANLKLGMRGISVIGNRHHADQKDHALLLEINGNSCETAYWNGKEAHTIELANLPIEWLKERGNTLSIRIPKRTQGEPPQLIVDVSVFNWASVTFPQRALAEPAMLSRIHLREGADRAEVQVHIGEGSYVAYGNRGSRIELPPHKGAEDSGFRQVRLSPGETQFHLVHQQAYRSPASLLAYSEGSLRQADQQADYLMLAHPDLIESVKPLAEFHRKRGLKVALIDIRQVYDHFNHGIFHPKAIRDLVAYSHQHWQKPAPRFVLLVGDASWDTKNEEFLDQNYPDLAYITRKKKTRFSKIPSTHYPGAHLNNRNLIPTWNFFNSSGHSASDNWFGCIKGDDFYPDVAIGRFPVVTPEEVSTIVTKTIDYVTHTKVGPWRRNFLWITNEEAHFQRQTDHLAELYQGQGFHPTRIFPQSQEKSNEQHTQAIIDQLDQGQFLVNFLGHGGRFIWRTGPPDFRKNHDLFTLTDVDKLKPAKRLPIILSLTCFSAPFDHPGADSIGEKFLRVPERGTVAFIGASWRNSPHRQMNQAFLDGLTGAPTVGEGIVAAKAKIRNRVAVETYNLMGDPALPLLPAPNSLAIHASQGTQQSSLNIRSDLSTWTRAQWQINLYDAKGNTIATYNGRVAESDFNWTHTLESGAGEHIHAVGLYVWDEQANRDAYGQIQLEKAVAQTDRADH